jgi:Fe2+ or Zn2+ uptake regulation protein
MKRSPSLVPLLEASDLKKTPFREELLRVFAQAKAPLSAAQVFEALLAGRKLKGQRFDRVTLFRNLKTLVEKGILNTTEFGTGAAYYCLNTHAHHHHHIFCVRCETAKPLEVCAAGPMIKQARQLGFKVLSHKMELLGLCPRCSR